jgi:hypothetical protein
MEGIWRHSVLHTASSMTATEALRCSSARLALPTTKLENVTAHQGSQRHCATPSHHPERIIYSSTTVHIPATCLMSKKKYLRRIHGNDKREGAVYLLATVQVRPILNSVLEKRFSKAVCTVRGTSEESRVERASQRRNAVSSLCTLP